MSAIHHSYVLGLQARSHVQEHANNTEEALIIDFTVLPSKVSSSTVQSAQCASMAWQHGDQSKMILPDDTPSAQSIQDRSSHLMGSGHSHQALPLSPSSKLARQ